MRKALNALAILLALGTPVAVAIGSPGPVHTFRDGAGLPAMVVVPPGSVLLGSSEIETTREGRAPALAASEHPQRTVTFERGFAMSQAHVTQAEFARFVRATRRDMAGCVVAIAGKWSEGRLADYDFRNPGWRQRGNEPAVCVDWDDATAYVAWLSVRTGKHYRLPHEDEWEYAARGGRETARWWSDGISAICAHANGGDRAYAATMPDDKSANLACRDGYARTNPVDRFPANPFGLHDMLGNAWQWTADCFTPVAGRAAPGRSCQARSIRGGSWHNGVAILRAATRFSLPPTMRSSSLGFRVVRDMP
ncbi:formylglycine-generating enzyme family protein [Novosphingobium sp. Gsoil 351]|uniref:formylglycine-generating enzyme family protein n=1 Tax=Novosphingobium sp. Gsoil 351 TaxID=2675225 RepID=UPI0012B4B701|nr:formylglycine-generating enzyme family protein [Novosphingobium sp. Gsoil 351]QGN55846.1 SUMF1/EgtB/PvdO family nonheme iron enzyme [Novosphingobium sp. Gsoil 351]